ncbi:formimidoylglutamate deiminase [soil metagenome]
MTRWHAPWAWLDSGVTADVAIETESGLITSVETDVAPSFGDRRLTGLVYPGFANTHSHVFHRLVRGHVEQGRGNFWSWRDAMYSVAAGLDPDSLRQTSVATFREMVASGYTSVAEFHYLHHQPNGQPYKDPNVMADAVADAAAEVGIRLLLLDTCYLSAGFGRLPESVQVRFADPDADAWAARVSAWQPPAGVTVGAAIHSVRAVDADSMETVMEWADGRPVHVHLSEQVAENEQCLAMHGRTPTQVLSDAGVLGPSTTAVHATHLDEASLTLISDTDTKVSMCPTTERWLADGVGPSTRLMAAGVAIGIGSDSQASIDPFEEMRLLELHQRLLTGTTGSHTVSQLVDAGVGPGATMGRDGPAGITVGAPGDLVDVDIATPRTAGVAPEGLVFAASSADVSTVVIGGAEVRPR